MSDEEQVILKAWALMTDYHHTLYLAAATLRLNDGHHMVGVFPGDDRNGCIYVDTEPSREVGRPEQSFDLSDYDYSKEGKLWQFDWPEDPKGRWFDTLQDAYDTWASERDA